MSAHKGARKRTGQVDMEQGSRSRFMITVITVLAFFASILAAFTVVAAPANATGNNGTIKVHAEGSDSGTESNEPKVCAFNLEFFGFDEGTDGYVTFEVQGGDGPTGVAAGPFEVGTANADGYFDSEYFNVEGGPVIQNGHYKVTLFGKFNGEPNYADEKAKSKVFKVDCPSTEEPPPPTIKECPETLGTVVVTPSNLQGFTFTETRATGHYEFLESGLRIYTEGATSTDKVAGYKAVNVPLIDVGDPSLTFDNTSGGGIPGSQLVIDFDGNGTTDGILVGEDVYMGDWWLTNSSAQFVKDGAPNTGGGSGSEWFGTLNEWLASYPDAVVKAFGFSLGSGVKGDGIINKITFNCTEYVFTTDPEVEPEGNLTVSSTCESITFSSDGVKPEGAEQVFKLDGVVKAAGTYPVTAGSHTVELFVNGEKVDSETITVAACEVENEGSNNSSSPACLKITVGTPTGVKPEGATVVVKLDGVVTQPGTYTTTAGSHVVTTFVNGELVDTDTVVVADCPVVTPPVVVPPVVTPPVVVPPVVTPPVVNPPVKDNPSASVNASCVTARFGEAEVRLNNKRADDKNTFRIVKAGRDKLVTVKAGAKKLVNLTGLPVGSVIKVKADGKTLAKTKVPGGCAKTPPPNTGFRMAASAT